MSRQFTDQQILTVLANLTKTSAIQQAVTLSIGSRSDVYADGYQAALYDVARWLALDLKKFYVTGEVNNENVSI